MPNEQEEDIRAHIAPVSIEAWQADGLGDALASADLELLLKEAPDEDGSASAGLDITSSAAHVYEEAVRLMGAGDTNGARQLFRLLKAHSPLENIGVFGLLALAAHEEDFETALSLANELIENDCRIPRVYLIAGYSALQLKQTKYAKRYYALASRLARKNPAYRDEQRAVQRELLMLQFA
ncbi:MAG: hypothetical protein AAGE89_03235 [Pseudomonadota bacterium]